jgi:hypothetical protein
MRHGLEELAFDSRQAENWQVDYSDDSNSKNDRTANFDASFENCWPVITLIRGIVG